MQSLLLKVSMMLMTTVMTLTTYAQTKKPNVILILTDQQSYKMMSCANDTFLKTPAIDEIVENGYRFNKSYCANPVCSPSRFSLMTGHYGSEIGLRLNNVAVDTSILVGILSNGTLGTCFKNAGYEVLYGGKTHLPFESNSTAEQNLLSDYGFETITRDSRRELAELAAEIIKNRRKEDKPLMMVVSLINPHDICFVNNYTINGGNKPKNASISEWAQVQEVIAKYHTLSDSEKVKQLPALPTNFLPVNDEPTVDARQHNTNTSMLRIYSWAYHRLTEIVDKQIALVLQGLEQSTEKDNTIVVFTSDHGDMNGAHQKTAKNRFYDESARIPFIFSGPGIRKGIVDNETLTCNGLDLIPTLCDLVGIEKPVGLSGISLKPQLIEEKKAINSRILFIESVNGFMMLDGRYKYALYDGIGKIELLLDTKKDPLETKNLVSNGSYKKIHSEMNVGLRKWMSSRALLLDDTK